jgi:hypothetical protein
MVESAIGPAMSKPEPKKGGKGKKFIEARVSLLTLAITRK